MSIDDRVLGTVLVLRAVSKKLASDLLLSTTAYEALKAKGEAYGHKSPSDENLHVAGEEEIEDSSVNTDVLVELLLNETGNRAIAPDAKSVSDTAERRRQMIQIDIPITVILRRKADCTNFEPQITFTTNEIVMKRLTQVLSNLRQGLYNKKAKNKDKGKLKEETKIPKLADDSIFGDNGNYVPFLEKKGKTKQYKNVDLEEGESYFEEWKSSNSSSKMDDENVKKKKRMY
ncbi:protein Red [Nephila pilipes]|uniref:Protein Red n=1 Tax=Nephila pilipes TaxID=299642 RepID=A0A8X6UDC8_NEPPI|nr:protein Red [Nephila pilipes]